jgi:hypothetical protein
MERKINIYDLSSARGDLNRENSILFRILMTFPILNALADTTIYYFVEVNSTGIHPGLVRGALLIIFILYFGFGRILRVRANYLILFFLSYLFLLSLVSSNVNHSLFDGYLKWFVAMMMFPVGYYYFRTYDDIVKYNFYLTVGALIVCLNLFIAQITGFGISAYGGESFYTGGAGVGITNQLALVLLTYPVLLRNLKRFNKLQAVFISFVGILSFSFLILAMKRAGIIGLAGGGILFLFLTQSRTRAIRYIIIAFAIILLTLPLYREILLNRYEARLETIEEFDKEGRYLEVFYVFQEFRDGNGWQKLFGSEAFNTGEFFGMKYFGRGRMIHGDFSALLYGSGLIGIILYFSIFGHLAKQGISYAVSFRGQKLPSELAAVFLSLLFATFLISATGSGTIGERCLVYSYFGASVGFLSAKMKEGKFPA